MGNSASGSTTQLDDGMASKAGKVVVRVVYCGA
ncbi:hypothetical protein RvY_15509 [Ramazzottius varieornatus]|uniref:Uncharacterized protein n=1 Tax=Ramazzottius varieornatus TaxID=947166 RepID=A0A1D1VWD7_RAMVA|nr:hypothetical protein RvY_15509 [Ramazzottius varieornatus]